jgi:beta-lactamase regulating signal transducer with metallopeptidase domain
MQNIIITAFTQTLTVSAISGLVIAALWALTSLLDKRYSPRWRCWAWAALSLWLIVPVTFYQGSPAIDVTLPDVAIVRPAASASHQADGLTQGGGPGAGDVTSRPVEGEPVEQVEKGRPKGLTMAEALAAGWVFGAVAFTAWRVVAALRFKAKLRRRWRHCDSLEVMGVIRLVMDELGYRREMDVRVSEEAASPFVIGLAHPVLVLPEREYDLGMMTNIIRHELTHCIRRDLWSKLLVTAANALHWFNPLVWLMARACERDIELACDEKVMRGQDGIGRKEYCESILLTVKPGSRRQTAAITTSFSVGAKDLKVRFEAIMQTATRRSGAAAFCLAMAFAVLAGCTARISIVSSDPAASKDTPSDMRQVGGTGTLEGKDGLGGPDDPIGSSDDATTPDPTTPPSGASIDSTPAPGPSTTGPTSQSGSGQSDSDLARDAIDDYYYYVAAGDFGSLGGVVSSGYRESYWGRLEEARGEADFLTTRPSVTKDVTEESAHLGYGGRRRLFSVYWPDAVRTRQDGMGLPTPSYIIMVREDGQWRVDSFVTGP